MKKKEGKKNGEKGKRSDRGRGLRREGALPYGRVHRCPRGAHSDRASGGMEGGARRDTSDVSGPRRVPLPAAITQAVDLGFLPPLPLFYPLKK